jgi:hypothetical protein
MRVQTDGHTEITEVIVAFRNIVDAPKNEAHEEGHTEHGKTVC